MRRIRCISLILLLSFACSLLGCSEELEYKNNVIYKIDEPTNKISSDINSETDVIKILQYAWDGWGVSAKYIRGSAARDLTALLEGLPPSGETVQKISDKPLTEGSGSYPCKRGTLFIEANNKIYRLENDKPQIYLVETHLGAGEVLILSEECREAINDAHSNWPYDCWYGTYTYANDTLEMRHSYAAETDIIATVKSITVEGGYSPENSIIIEFVSKVDTSLSLQLNCQASSDHLAQGDSAFLKLKAGVPETVTLEFGGFSFNYYIYMIAGNTKLYITIEMK